MNVFSLDLNFSKLDLFFLLFFLFFNMEIRLNKDSPKPGLFPLAL